MTTQLEQLGSLERRLSMAVPLADIEKDVQKRLRDIARGAKVPGFRPGKAPIKMIEQSYGAQVQAEVLGDAVSKAFGDAVSEHKLRVAGEPNIERREGAGDSELGFTATFEVYPEIVLGDIGSLEIERATCEVGDAEIDRTIDILRKQRVTWTPADRPAQAGDRATIDFTGTLDGVAFEGGSATDFPFVLGEGRMLADFETGVTGASAGDQRNFPVAFPADYTAKDLAGKTAEFAVTVKSVEAPQLPPIDGELAKQLGVPGGEVDKLRADVKNNLEREVGQRLRARTKGSVMDALPSIAAIDLPKALVKAENAALGERAKSDLAARGVDVKNVPVPLEAFTEQAEKRVRLGLIVGEIVRANSLQAKPDQIRKQIEEFAQAYENPGEVIRYYFSDRERLAEIEAIVVEQNVVDWALSKAKVNDKALSFDELMQNG